MSPLSTPRNRLLFLGVMLAMGVMTCSGGLTTYFAAREAEALFNERVKIAKNTADTARAKEEAMKSKEAADKARRDAELTNDRVAKIEARLREGGVPDKLDAIAKTQGRIIEFIEMTTGVPKEEIVPPKAQQPQP